MDIGATSLMSLLTARPASEGAREDRLKAAAEAKLRDAKAAVETLKQRRSQASEEHKAMARQKIEQLKARLQALKSMAAVDPKGTARMAAQLARELGAAVKAYAAAGGDTAGMDTSSTPASAPDSAVSGESGVEGETPADGGASTVPEAPRAGSSAEGAEASKDEDEADGKSFNPYHQAIDQANARAAEISRRSSEKQADTDFLTEVRKLAAGIKQLVRQATEKAPGGDEALSPDEAREMKAKVADMDREIEQASAGLGGGLSLLV